MRKTKGYPLTKFSSVVLKKAFYVWRGFVPESYIKLPQVIRSATVGDATWSLDSDEEFFAFYRQCTGAHFTCEGSGSANGPTQEFIYCDFQFLYTDKATSVTVLLPQRHQIEQVFEIFEDHRVESIVPTEPPKRPPKPVIFIGHGRNQQWRDLKDHLQDKHGYRVEAYEIGARAGRTR